MEKFNLGQIIQTRSIAASAFTNMRFFAEVNKALEDYKKCNWGATCESDCELNDEAVKTGNDRILARYTTSDGDIFICTEYDRSYTTIMFCSEY